MTLCIRQQRSFPFNGSGREIYKNLTKPNHSFNAVLKGVDTQNLISSNFEMGQKGVERVGPRELHLHCLLPTGKATAYLVLGKDILICATDIPNGHPALSVLYEALGKVLDRLESKK